MLCPAGKFGMDYWESSTKVIADPKFLDTLKEFDKDNIPGEVITKIRPYLSMPELSPDVVKKASKAAHGLALWVFAIEKYDKVAKVCTCCHQTRRWLRPNTALLSPCSNRVTRSQKHENDLQVTATDRHEHVP